MTFYDYFDRVWIISLADRQDRRRRIEPELARIGLPLTPGKVEFFDGIRCENADGFASVGMRGCLMSHSAVLALGQASGCKRIITLEDDIIFHPDFKGRQSAAIKALEDAPGWGVVNFGHYTLERITGSGLVPAPREAWGMHFYATNGWAIPKLKAWFDGSLERPVGHPDGGRVGPDGAINHFRWANPDVPSFLYEPPLAMQSNSASDIAGGKWFDRIPFAGRLIRSTRDLLQKQGKWK